MKGSGQCSNREILNYDLDNKQNNKQTKKRVHTPESKAKLSKARKEALLSGKVKVLNGRNIKYNDLNLKSSWELIFALYCDLTKINYQYENQKIQTHKIWINDFEIDNILYEIGWHNHQESIEAFKNNNHQIYWFGPDEIDLLKMFIPSKLKKQYNLPKIDLKNKRYLTSYKDQIKDLQNIAKEIINAKTKENQEFRDEYRIWFKDNNPNNKIKSNIIILDSSKSLKTYKQYQNHERFKLEEISPNIYKASLNPKLATCSNIYCKKEFEFKKEERKYCSKECKETSLYNKKEQEILRKISIEELSDIVFKKPLLEIAKELNINYKDLILFAKNNNIKTPETNYWHKKSNEILFNQDYFISLAKNPRRKSGDG